MKRIRTEDAVGHVLCHDMTQIIPGQFKGPRFRKGHVVQPEDIPVLLSMGKEQLFKTVMADGVLPRKTFSMGHAQDKRYYVEARKIR